MTPQPRFPGLRPMTFFRGHRMFNALKGVRRSRADAERQMARHVRTNMWIRFRAGMRYGSGSA